MVKRIVLSTWASACLISILSVFIVSTTSYAVPIISDSYNIDLILQSSDNLRGIAVGQKGYGNNVYVADDTTGSILRVTKSGNTKIFATGLNPGNYTKLEFDTSGAYGGALYACNPKNGSGGIDPIYKIGKKGEISLFFSDAPGHFDLLTSGLAFGKGGGFGDLMYVQDVEHDDLVVVSPTGTWIELGSGVSGFQIAEDLLITNDTLYGSYAYFTDQSHNLISRMNPMGTTEVFSSGYSGRALAQGAGSFGAFLYLGTNSGDIYALDQYGNANLFISEFGGIIEDIAFSRNSMWITVEGQGLYNVNQKCAPVPEPATLLLLGSGLFGFAGFRKKFKK